MISAYLLIPGDVIQHDTNGYSSWRVAEIHDIPKWAIKHILLVNEEGITVVQRFPYEQLVNLIKRG